MAGEHGPDHGVVVVSEPGPLTPSYPSLLRCRGHDVSEEHRRQHNLALSAAAGTGQELLDLVHDSVDVTCDEGVVSAGQHHEPSAGDVLGQVSARAEVDVPVFLSVDDQRGDRDRRQQRPDIPFEDSRRALSELPGADAEALSSGPPRSKSVVTNTARGEQLQGRARVARLWVAATSPHG
jgi:hypothetical protein